jgi:hypothetical protein
MLRLLYAEQGKEFHIDAFSMQRYSLGSLDICQHVTELTAVPKDQQILILSNGKNFVPCKNQLEPDMSLYLFNKSTLRTIQIPQPKLPLLKKTSFTPSLPGEDRGILLIERQLHKQASRAFDLIQTLDQFEEFSATASKEILVVYDSISVLRRYQETYIATQLESFDKLSDRFKLHKDRTGLELNMFDEAVDTLHSIQLHPSLQTPDRKYLSHVFDMDQLRKWKESFLTELDRLTSKFSEVQIEVNTLVKEVEPISVQLSETVPVQVASAKLQLRKAIDLYMDYRKLVEKYNQEGDATAAARIYEEKWDLKTAEISQEYDKVLATLPSYEALVSAITETRTRSTADLSRVLKRVTETTARVRDIVKSQVSMLNSLLKRSEKRLSFLTVPKQLPEAYENALVEISRRRKFLHKAESLQMQLNKLLDIEIREREEFLKKYRHVLPQSFIPELSAAPYIRPFNLQRNPDSALPAIDIPMPDSFPYSSLYCISEVNSGSGQENRSKECEALERDYKMMKCIADENIKRANESEQIMNGMTVKLKLKDEMLKQAEVVLDEIRKHVSDLELDLKERKDLISKLHFDKEALEKKVQSYISYSSSLEKDCSNLRALNEKHFNDLTLASKELSSRKTDFQQLQRVFTSAGLSGSEDISTLITAIESIHSQNEIFKNRLETSITFTNFNEGSLALFFPGPEGKFLAFNFNAPFHYLDLDSLSEQAQRELR